MVDQVSKSRSTLENNEILSFLRKIEAKRKVDDFDAAAAPLLEEASTNGLDPRTMKLLMKVITSSGLPAAKLVTLTRCLIPRDKLTREQFSPFLRWFTAHIWKLTISVATALMQWLIGCWEYQIVDRDLIYACYDVFFYHFIKQPRLGSIFARLVYIMTRPEDVSRRQVERLLKLKDKTRRLQRHIMAVLTLFKSYKPEVMPERCISINIQSIWRPLPDSIRLGLENARRRLDLNDSPNQIRSITWSMVPVNNSKKQSEPLIPALSYINVGSNLLDDGLTKYAFDIMNPEDLGKYATLTKLPCNTTSLLNNCVGYHLLTYSDQDYQSRFMFVLYNVLWQSFVFENQRFSRENMERLVDSISGLSDYMQQSIPMVGIFLQEYLPNQVIEPVGKKLLRLLEWSCDSLDNLPELLDHLKFRFFCSSIDDKLELIEILSKLRANVVFMCYPKFHEKRSPFLDRVNQVSEEYFGDVSQFFSQFAEDLTTSALICHPDESQLVLPGCASFYEVCYTLEILRSKEAPLRILIPRAPTFLSFVGHFVVFDRVCKLLLCYEKAKDRLSEESLEQLESYQADLASALWDDSCLSKRMKPRRVFLSNIRRKTIRQYSMHNLDKQMNIQNHYEMMPVKIVLEDTTGNKIADKEQALVIANYSFPNVKNLTTSLIKKGEIADENSESENINTTVEMDLDI